MIDFYRKSVLSQSGKDAGNKTMSDYLRNIQEKYPQYLSKIKEEKEKQKQTREDYDLYL